MFSASPRSCKYRSIRCPGVACAYPEIARVPRTARRRAKCMEYGCNQCGDTIIGALLFRAVAVAPPGCVKERGYLPLRLRTCNRHTSPRPWPRASSALAREDVDVPEVERRRLGERDLLVVEEQPLRLAAVGAAAAGDREGATSCGAPPRAPGSGSRATHRLRMWAT